MVTPLKNRTGLQISERALCSGDARHWDAATARPSSSMNSPAPVRASDEHEPLYHIVSGAAPCHDLVRRPSFSLHDTPHQAGCVRHDYRYAVRPLDRLQSAQYLDCKVGMMTLQKTAAGFLRQRLKSWEKADKPVCQRRRDKKGILAPRSLLFKNYRICHSARTQHPGKVG